ncbi:GNAT family N-acetyltransferase [Archangium violaceum]|uniref:GNAT family N-acetyltransferase n=1 Tax=Archangium violaceum TaxID=83451 RepID=UPI001952067A|nr:GNAT family N-acetyltransferase [Archangium violaceum]QRN97435.1 GNAT family N-acetyltransferase [Archangium violaceum]
MWRTTAPRSEFLFEVGEYRVRRVSEEDTPLLRELGERCLEHIELHYGSPPDPAQMIRELLSDLPPNKTLADKFGMGVFDGTGRLVGGIDVIRDYPEPGEWYLGLLVLDPGHRNHGLGEKLMDALIGWLRRREAAYLRLAVSEHNAAGQRFWTRLGFQPVKQVIAEFGNRQSVFHVMRRALEVR